MKKDELVIDEKVLEELRRADELKELLPRNQCQHYVNENRGKASLLTKERFDSFCREGKFADGPHRDKFGDNLGEPYIPNRQAFGKLKDGRIVYCEINQNMQEKVKSYLESLV